MMPEPEGLHPEFIKIWRHVLMGWLEWPEERFAAWVASWDFKITHVECHRVWFYHDDVLHWVLRLLVPDDLAHRLEKQRTRRMYHDLAQLMHEDLVHAIAGGPQYPVVWTEGFDWAAAKWRVEAVLQKYGAGLPRPSEVTSYEKRILEADNA
jgi:hypothetical protein